MSKIDTIKTVDSEDPIDEPDETVTPEGEGADEDDDRDDPFDSDVTSEEDDDDLMPERADPEVEEESKENIDMA